MERKHFELAQGYLNIDHEALMFTRSGNWQDAAGTKERSNGDTPGKLARNAVGIALVLVGGSVFALGKLRDLDAFPLFGIALLGLGIYSFYGKARHDFAPSFRIPLSKVLDMEIVNERLQIRFLDGAHRERMHTPIVPPAAGEFALTMFRSARAPM